ncbi:MAG: hypothetical protein AABX00_05935 [Nanoarchaeota archaeon]
MSLKLILTRNENMKPKPARTNSGIHGNTVLQLEEIGGVASSGVPTSFNEDRILAEHRELNRMAPSLFKRHQLSDVVYLLDEYGIDAVIEGYHASQITGFPLEYEVMMCSTQPADDGKDLMDPDILEIMVQDQSRGPLSPTPWEIFSQGAHRIVKRKSLVGLGFEYGSKHPLDLT